MVLLEGLILYLKLNMIISFNLRISAKLHNLLSFVVYTIYFCDFKCHPQDSCNNIILIQINVLIIRSITINFNHCPSLII